MIHLKRLSLLAGGILVLGLLTLALLPSPIDPAAYEPAPGPALSGLLEPNEALRTAEVLARDLAHGPEDVDVDPQGRIVAGLEDGRILRLTPRAGGGYRSETWVETGGRPLGLAFSPDGSLWIADARKGLLSVDPEGRIQVRATQAEGLPFGFTDDLDVASDGTVYFSDASSRYGVDEYLYDLLEARPHGRLLAYRPGGGPVRVLLDGLYFANGVALARNEDFVLVNETYRYRILRYWLKGPRAGTSEVFLDALPGFPDGVSANRQGVFWVALFTVRNPMVDRLHPRPWAKSLLAKLPKALWPKPAPYGLVLAVNENGRILASLHDPGGETVRQITSAQQQGRSLLLGNLSGYGIGRWEVPEELSEPQP